VPRLRKFGGRCVLGFQSIAQVSSTYGKGAADTIVENCANTLILLCSASEHGGTSEFASRLIGQREVTHTTQSTSRRPGEWRRSTTMSEQVNIEPAVMASEIERLPTSRPDRHASGPQLKSKKAKSPTSLAGFPRAAVDRRDWYEDCLARWGCARVQDMCAGGGHSSDQYVVSKSVEPVPLPPIVCRSSRP
jgi:hypothetical protein